MSGQQIAGDAVSVRVDVAPRPDALVDAVLLEVLAGPLTERPGAVSVLDCGGGSGRFAVPLAAAGALVTVVDISVDALATLRRRADEAGVGALVVGVQGDVESLADTLGRSSVRRDASSQAAGEAGFDAVLAHGVVDAVDDAAAAFAAMAAAVRPGGVLSVLVSNPAAAVLARTLAGDLAGAERELAEFDRGGDAGRPTPAAVEQWCAVSGLDVEHVRGIGVFRDLVPGTALDAPGARAALDRLERSCARRSPFAQIAGRVHVLARRPGA